MQRLKKSDKSPCKEWAGSRDKDGYGRVWCDGKYIRAHRLVLAKHLDVPIESLRIVRHRCDNPGCVNVEHLLEGSVADNNQDRAKRDRSTKLRVDRRKLTDEDADAIRSVYVPRSREYGARALGRVFGVDNATILNIVHGRTYTCSV